MKKLIFPLIIIATLFIVALFGFVWWGGATKAPSKEEVSKRVVINKGASASQVANKLKTEGVIKNAFAFRLYTQVTNNSKKIPPGQFTIPVNLNVKRVVGKLLDGPDELWVTIPEGLRREQVVEKLISSLEFSGEEAVIFRQQFLASSKSQEGFLFPDTYLFPRDADSAAVVNKMTDTFNSKVSNINDNNSLTLQQTVTLASLIERETINDNERPLVAGIILKRLEAGWPLQIDASVQFIIGDSSEWWPILTRDDLEVNSQYNTYKFPGMPPGPIASPGVSSLEAAFSPESSDYWYYIHDPEGTIHYAETLSQHNSNVRVYLGK